MNDFSLPSFAKINLSLRVFGRHAASDLHEVRTVLQTISLCDRLTFTVAETSDFKLTCDSDEVPIDERNLIVQAAHLLRENLNVRSETFKRTHVTLEKRIPVQAGLGGGSSNAAIALIGLRRLWNLDIETKELLALGASLGADVPFFFVGGTALGTGSGATIKSLDDVPAKLLIVIMPDAKVSTAEAYRSLQRPILTNDDALAILSGSRFESEIDKFFDIASLDKKLNNKLINDFESVVLPAHPSIKFAKQELIEHGATHALLSGSGASVFGIFDDKETQTQAHDELINMSANQAWRVFACRTINQAEYAACFDTDII